MKKLLLILNPRAGKMESKSALFDIISIFCKYGWLVTTHITAASGEATQVSGEAAKSGEYNIIVCCGGDGTLNEVINGVVMSGTQIPIGYIPAGSTNDFASSTKIPTDLLKAATAIARCEKVTGLDAGLFNGEHFFSYIASFGAFTATSYSVPQSMKNTLGHFAYVVAGIKDFLAIKPYKVGVRTNDETFEGEYIFGAVSNSFSVGGIIKLKNQTVSLNDGVFEVLFIKQPKNPIHIQKILWGLLNTDFSDTEVFKFIKTSKILLHMPENVAWTLDGEFAKGSENVVIETLPSAIKLWYDPEYKSE